MINFEALFKISYGLYIVSTGDKNYGNGFISNSVFQITAEPPRFIVCCSENNFTCGLIEKYGFFSASIIHQSASPDIFGRFGYRSGRDINKFEGMNVIYGTTGTPVVLNDAIAYIDCKVSQKISIGTHALFIGELINAEIIDDNIEPMTYAYYRQIRKGAAPKNAPTYVDKSKLEQAKQRTNKYKCTACGHIYDESIESIKFDDLPSDWKCPVCGADKDDFIKI